MSPSKQNTVVVTESAVQYKFDKRKCAVRAFSCMYKHVSGTFCFFSVHLFH